MQYYHRICEILHPYCSKETHLFRKNYMWNLAPCLQKITKTESFEVIDASLQGCVNLCLYLQTCVRVYVGDLHIE